ncbi:MAG: 2-oxoacid:acceptor oxidoreductase subunit alpha [Chloroflexi bacterium]|uniref:2-oxoacid:acceptor oxidoreductase subunit alpha n=1 Tax=Candidatus Chlorohelix allophototropha TaxID=3003348 RepID=A0A8T7M6I6_9CHLR|nr:2-oxoacid:acceptor oxidoreductase subunit alpha [Chloroflexota bacterium]WJW69621.1 2-oxoacid:acceptor oxidoreductase subunit alpha [Chloroflexota bacterium L227-S17]
MTVLDTRPGSQYDSSGHPEVVNDFSIVIATVNGSGSQTANNTIIRSIFKMGIPVNGKNIFPSNISGLPTWYTVRVSKDGYVARRQETEILVAFNLQTADADLQSLKEGGACFYPDDYKFMNPRKDVVYYPLPVKQLVKESGADTKLKDYIANMVYVGGLAEILGIDLAKIKEALVKHFNGKAKPVELNYGVVSKAAEYVRQNLPKKDIYRVAPLDLTHGKILIEGNTAAGLGAIFGGVSLVSWYPITPSTSVVDTINEYLHELRTDPASGKLTCAVVQAEDEIAAIGMLVGAGWAGCRAMTATSGPGISLMTEFAGLAYFAEVPLVIWDIMRMGPSTGLPTRTSQGDILTAYFLGHGDTRHVCLLPGNMQECFEFGTTSFDLAEHLQTPVFVLSDLDFGMNLWMTEPFQYPEKPLDRGKVLSEEDLKRLGSFKRYADLEGDGVGWRTLPGNPHPMSAYFSRGTGHNAEAAYSERPDDWEENLDRLARKHDTARTLVPPPVVQTRAGANIGVIAYGSSDPAIVEACDLLEAKGVAIDYLRLRALPLEEITSKFIEEHEILFVVEMNYDGQMHKLLQIHSPENAARLKSIAHCDGLSLTAQFITEKVMSVLQ